MENYTAIRRVLYYTMILNLLVTIAKLVVGYATGALSLVADGYDSLFDSASNVVGLVGIYFASRPPDRTHPYGHRKFETLAATSISVMLFVTTLQLVQSAISRFRDPVVPVVNVWTFAALALSIGMHLYVATYEHRRGKQLKSEVLVADALHTRADVLVSVSVLAGLIVVRLGYPIVDAILALVIAALIAKIGVDIIRENSRILADAVALDESVVERIVSGVPGVSSLHNIRSRGQEDDIHLDLHVRVEADMPMAQAHYIAHEVQQRLMGGIEGVRDVIVHTEPQRDAGAASPDIGQRIREIAGRVPGASVHSVQVRVVGAGLYATLHLETDPALSMAQAHALADQIEGMIRGEIPQTAEVDVHIEPKGSGGRPTAAADQATYRRVRALLDQATADIGGLSACHDARVLRQGDDLLVSGHWGCPSDLTVQQAHALSSQLEQRIRERLPQATEVVVHVEPLP